MKKLFVCVLIVMAWISLTGSCLAANKAAADSPQKKHGATKVKAFSVGIYGGRIFINEDCPIRGLEIIIPRDTYASRTTVEVSFLKAPDGKYADKGTPCSPIIMVNDGGKKTNKMIKVKIPVNRPEKGLAVIEYIDPATLGIEGVIVPSESKKTYVKGVISNFSMYFMVMGVNPGTK